VTTALAAAATASTAPSNAAPPVRPDGSIQAEFKAVGGADVLPATRTVPHWFGQTLDPSNGVTYGYNMVGANPSTCSGGACSTTIQADITPLIVNIGGRTFSGNDVLGPTLRSPQFATDDYGKTTAATDSNGSKGKGGTLSQGDSGLQLQLQDATMRAQFNEVGTSNYHLKLNPVVQPAVVIDVPQNQGTLQQSVRGVVYAAVSYSWWSAQINNLEQSADPTHLPIYLTDNVLLYDGTLDNCCTIGYHGTRSAGLGGGSGGSNGNASVQTFAWASYLEPGVYNPISVWALQDIHPLSHEIAEWADDPFVNNWVEPWLTPTAPQYGCTNILETGDPVVGIGFSKGTNTYNQVGKMTWTSSAGTFTAQVTDGTYHPEDEVLLPWFMRLAPADAGSEPTQSKSGGRYTLMGDLNPFPGFRAPATGC
jgi:hypothetical protein